MTSLRQAAKAARIIIPALALAAGATVARGQCTGFSIQSSSGSAIVPGTTDAGNHGDDTATGVTLPFPVSLYGASYNTAMVSSNGNLQFAGGNASYTNVCLPDAGMGVMLAPHWDDLRTDGAGNGIFTSVSGVAPNRVFNIEWRAVYFNASTTALSFEIRLYEDNTHFEFIYGANPQTGTGATVGVQNAAVNSNQFSCNTGSLSSGLMLTFAPINSATVLCASGAASPAGVNNCNGATTLLTVTVTPGTNPPSTGIAVTGNLSSINGSTTQQFYDDGTHGDAAAGNNVFSFLANVPSSVSPGAKIIGFSCSDQQARTGSGSISLGVNCVTAPNPTIGPDVVTWNITDVPYWGNNGAGVAAYSVGTTSSNEGDYPVNWIDASNYLPDYDQTQHPVISQNMYRLKTYGTAPNTYQRFEQLGQSWLKHGFVSTNSPGGGGPNPCNTGTQGPLGANLWRYSQQQYQGVGGDVLSVGCTDTYGGGLNGSQGSLGAKSIVNATLGASAFLRGNGNDPNGTINERLQVPLADVTTQPAGTRFFVDAYYVTADDAQFVRPGQTVATNSLNNASWRELNASGMTQASVPFVGNVHMHDPGIFAWRAADAAVTLVTADHDDAPNPGTGYRNPDGSPSNPGSTIRSRYWVAAKATAIGGGLYRYEYAVYNHNSDRSGGSFGVPMPASATVTDLTFRAPLWHSGEPYSNAAWTNSRSGNVLTFATQTFAQNPNANALRWGELLNFGFTANVAPTTGAAAIGLFKPGSAGAPNSVNVNMVPVPIVPPPCGSADFNCDNNVGTDADIEAFFACLAGNCPAAPCTSSADFNGDGDTGTDADIEAFFRVLGGGTC